jgi:hypothetical protein
MTQAPTALTLYDQDYLLWTEDTINQLRNKNFHRVDLVNLIEEIEDLGKSQKRDLKSRLGELLEHILKGCDLYLIYCIEAKNLVW